MNQENILRVKAPGHCQYTVSERDPWMLTLGHRYTRESEVDTMRDRMGCRCPNPPKEQLGGNLRSIVRQAELAAQVATQKAARGAPELMTVAAASVRSDAATLVLSGSF
jgi:hypothetical protein